MHNRRYDEKRLIERFKGFEDIPEVDDDAVNVKKGLVGLGANIFDIRDISDASFSIFSQLF